MASPVICMRLPEVASSFSPRSSMMTPDVSSARTKTFPSCETQPVTREALLAPGRSSTACAGVTRATITAEGFLTCTSPLNDPTSIAPESRTVTTAREPAAAGVTCSVRASIRKEDPTSSCVRPFSRSRRSWNTCAREARSIRTRTPPASCSLAGVSSVCTMLPSNNVAWLETPALSTQRLPSDEIIPR